MLDVSKLTDQDLLYLKRRMEMAGERIPKIRESLDAAIGKLGDAIAHTEGASKLIPVIDPTVWEGQTNEAWGIAAQMSDLLQALRILRRKY